MYNVDSSFVVRIKTAVPSRTYFMPECVIDVMFFRIFPPPPTFRSILLHAFEDAYLHDDSNLVRLIP